MCSFSENHYFLFLTVIGGYNIYMRMNISEECSRKYFVWEALEKQVLCVCVEVLSIEYIKGIIIII